MMITPVLFILSITPSVIILLWLCKKDKYEQEPLSLLLKSFGLGALSAIAVIVFGMFSSIEPNTGNHFVDSFITAFFVAAIPEELFKFLFLYRLIWKNRNFSERFDGIIYAVFVSLGFATLENIIYVFQYGENVAYIRALTAVPAHALFGVAMGFYFSYAKFLPEYKSKYLGLAVTVPILLHGVYDFFAFASEISHPALSVLLTLVFYAFVILLWIQGFKKIKKLSADFYFQGIPANELQEYGNEQNSEVVEREQPENAETTPITPIYSRNWQEITPRLFENEKNAIMEKYPDALIETANGLVTAGLATNGNYQYLLQLTYARNYRKLKEQLRIYIIEPDLNELTAIANDIPCVKTDLSGNNYLAVAPNNQVSGAATIDNALEWIGLFEKWVNGEIELNEFVIN